MMRASSEGVRLICNHTVCNYLSVPRILRACSAPQKRNLSLNSVLQNKSEDDEASHREKCQRIIDYCFGNGPYPLLVPPDKGLKNEDTTGQPHTINTKKKKPHYTWADIPDISDSYIRDAIIKHSSSRIARRVKSANEKKINSKGLATTSFDSDMRKHKESSDAQTQKQASNKMTYRPDWLRFKTKVLGDTSPRKVDETVKKDIDPPVVASHVTSADKIDILLNRKPEIKHNDNITDLDNDSGLIISEKSVNTNELEMLDSYKIENVPFSEQSKLIQKINDYIAKVNKLDREIQELIQQRSLNKINEKKNINHKKMVKEKSGKECDEKIRHSLTQNSRVNCLYKALSTNSAVRSVLWAKSASMHSDGSKDDGNRINTADVDTILKDIDSLVDKTCEDCINCSSLAKEERCAKKEEFVKSSLPIEIVYSEFQKLEEDLKHARAKRNLYNKLAMRKISKNVRPHAHFLVDPKKNSSLIENNEERNKTASIENIKKSTSLYSNPTGTNQSVDFETHAHFLVSLKNKTTPIDKNIESNPLYLNPNECNQGGDFDVGHGNVHTPTGPETHAHFLVSHKNKTIPKEKREESNPLYLNNNNRSGVVDVEYKEMKTSVKDTTGKVNTPTGINYVELEEVLKKAKEIIDTSTNEFEKLEAALAKAKEDREALPQDFDAEAKADKSNKLNKQSEDFHNAPEVETNFQFYTSSNFTPTNHPFRVPWSMPKIPEMPLHQVPSLPPIRQIPWSVKTQSKSYEFQPVPRVPTHVMANKPSPMNAEQPPDIVTDNTEDTTQNLSNIVTYYQYTPAGYVPVTFRINWEPSATANLKETAESFVNSAPSAEPIQKPEDIPVKEPTANEANVTKASNVQWVPNTWAEQFSEQPPDVKLQRSSQSHFIVRQRQEWMKFFWYKSYHDKNGKKTGTEGFTTSCALGRAEGNTPHQNNRQNKPSGIKEQETIKEKKEWDKLGVFCCPEHERKDPDAALSISALPDTTMPTPRLKVRDDMNLSERMRLLREHNKFMAMKEFMETTGVNLYPADMRKSCYDKPKPPCPPPAPVCPPCPPQHVCPKWPEENKCKPCPREASTPPPKALPRCPSKRKCPPPPINPCKLKPVDPCKNKYKPDPPCDNYVGVEPELIDPVKRPQLITEIIPRVVITTSTKVDLVHPLTMLCRSPSSAREFEPWVPIPSIPHKVPPPKLPILPPVSCPAPASCPAREGCPYRNAGKVPREKPCKGMPKKW